MMVDDDGLHDFEIIMLMTIDIRIFEFYFIHLYSYCYDYNIAYMVLIWRNGPAML